MHLAFVDIVYDYTADRPDTAAALGGTTSAVCFLARELMKRGVSCTFFNKIKQPAEAHGIISYPIEALTDHREDPKYTAFVFPGRWVEWLVDHIREKTKAPFIVWMQESQFAPPLTPAMQAMTGVVFNSEWQKKVNQRHCLPHWKQTVIRNAMNPRFATLYAPGESILAAKTKPPVLLYAGVTPRGSFHLPKILEHLRAKRSDFSMEIYCDCAPTKDPKANAAYFNWMKSQSNVAHVGMVGQQELAQRMKRAALLVSPNPWPETSCIALIEALTAGLCAITTDRAVLPETSEDFAQHIEIEDPDHPLRFDMPMPYERFAEAIDRMMTRWLQQPQETERTLRVQIDHFLGRYQWPQRVAAWLDFLRSFN